jgi:hypothetical protein
MQQIRQVLKRKQAQLAQLTKEIDLLQQAEEKLREIAPLLAEGDEDDGSLLVEVEDEAAPAVRTATASAGTPAAVPLPESEKAIALRWP